jgi:hypothetical protein
LGAALLWNTLDRLEVGRVVLWDPVCDGAEYIAALKENHRRYLRAVEYVDWHFPLPGRGRPGATVELLGSTYSDRMVRDLAALRIDPRGKSRAVQLKWLATAPAAPQVARFEALARAGASDGNRVEEILVDCSWLDVASLESIVPDLGIAAALAAMVTET